MGLLVAVQRCVCGFAWVFYGGVWRLGLVCGFC